MPKRYPEMQNLLEIAKTGGWGEKTNVSSNYDLPLFSPQFHFSKNTSKEIIIVFQNETVVKEAFLTAWKSKQAFMKNKRL